MSRFSGDWDEEYNNQGLLFWHNVEQAIAGRKGRKVLEELRAALLAMPEKRLINGKLCDGKDVCAVGALVVERQAKAEGKDRSAVLAAYAPDENLNCQCSDERRPHHPGDGACLVCQGHLDQWVLEHPDRVAEAKYSIYVCERYKPDFEYEDAWDTVEDAAKVGVPRLAAYAIEYHNDEEASGLTPEQRYEETLRWIDKQLARPPLTRKRRVN